MSVSSGSDVTIPIQDSPPPPPSPYANRTAEKTEKSGRKTPEPRRDVTGIENKGFHSDSDLKKPSGSIMGDDEKKGHTEINMGNGGSEVNEAVNSELINMNIMNTIPAKPQQEFGPYEQMDDYFIPVNTHKKFMRRSEKLYVTKDKRKEGNCKKYFCWSVGVFILAAIVALAVLAAVGIIPQTSSSDKIIVANDADSIVQGNNSIPTTSAPEPSSTIVSSTLKPPTISPDNTYVPTAADVEFHITNMHYEAALNNKSSEQFAALSTKVMAEMTELLKETAGLDGVQIRISEFAPGSILVKMRIGWMNEGMDFETIKFRLANITNFGDFEIRPMSSYQVVNHCKFNKGGCSHNCAYDFESLEFICTCPETMLLDTDSKTCKDLTSSSPIPDMDISSSEPSAEPEVSSPEPEVSSPEPEVSSPEPEVSSPEPEVSPPEADSTAQPEPQPESEPEAEPESVPPVETEISTSTTTSTTTGAPRLEDIDIVSEDGSDIVQTTLAPPADEESVPVPEAPAHEDISSTTSTTTEAIPTTLSTTSTTTTTEVPPAEETPTEAQSQVAPNESEPVPDTPETEVETTLAPVPEHEHEEAPQKTEESAETRHETAETAHNETNVDINPMDVLALGTSTTTSTTTTTTEVPISTTTTTTAAPVVIHEETQSQPEEPVLSNLQRDSSEQSSVESPEQSIEVLPTNMPSSEEQQHMSHNSSERVGRQENYLPGANSDDSGTNSDNSGANSDNSGANSDISGEETTSLPVPVPQQQSQLRVRPTPDSAEFMAFGDSPPVQNSPLAGLLVSKELTGSAEISSSVQHNSQSDEREIEETTTFKSISLHNDVDVNHLDNATEVNPQAEHVRDHDNQETTVVSIETEEEEEVQPANRDHRDATLSPVIFENEGVISSGEEGVTTTTPSAVINTSTNATTTSTTTSSPSEHGNESENELS